MTISPELRQAFNNFRVGTNGHVYPASRALTYARDDIERGARHYTSSPWAKPVTNPRFPVEGHNARQMQWIEKPADMGLRFVGFADELSNHIKHTGWYTDAYGDSSIRGVVYQLPGRNGRARFVAGHDNADNGRADNGGPALIDWSTIYESDFESEQADARRQIGKSYWTPAMDNPGYWAEAAHESARKEAARGADEFTRVQAEQEREYQSAWQAGSQYADAMQERADAKAELRALLVERRAARAELAKQGIGTMVQGGALCAAIERQARALVETMTDAAEKARKLTEGDGGEHVSFWPGDKRLQEAFNEGAGESVL